MQSLAPGDQVLVVPRNGGGAVFQGSTKAVGSSARVMDLAMGELPSLVRGDRAVLVWLRGSERSAAEAVFVVAPGPAVSRFQLVSAWRPIERRIHPRFETNLRADIRNIHDGLTQEGTILDMSEGGLRVETRRPAQGSVEVLIHEGIESIRIACDVVGSSMRDQRAEVRLRFRELSSEQMRFVQRMVGALQAINEQGRSLLAS